MVNTTEGNHSFGGQVDLAETETKTNVKTKTKKGNGRQEGYKGRQSCKPTLSSCYHAR